MFITVNVLNIIELKTSYRKAHSMLSTKKVKFFGTRM